MVPMSSTSEVTIRTAVIDDAPALADIFTRAVLDQAPGFCTAAQTAAWASALTAERARSLIADHTTYVAERTGTVVGFATFVVPDVFDMLYVDPDHLVEGIGTALAAVIEQHAHRLGAGELRAEVSDGARIAFESFGFRHEQPHTKLLGDQTFTVTRMSKSLG